MANPSGLPDFCSVIPKNCAEAKTKCGCDLAIVLAGNKKHSKKIYRKRINTVPLEPSEF